MKAKVKGNEIIYRASFTPSEASVLLAAPKMYRALVMIANDVLDASSYSKAILAIVELRKIAANALPKEER